MPGNTSNKGPAEKPARARRDADALDDLLAHGRDESNDDAGPAPHPFDRPRDPDHLDTAERAEERAAFWSLIGEAPWSFDFFAAVRRLEALHHGLPGFGASSRAAEDPVRFCQHPSLLFAPCTVAECRPPSSQAPTRLFVNFMGMFGPNGPLPLHLTEHAHSRELHHRDFTFSRFVDIFNHRMISLFYRAWSASQMPASFDRTPRELLTGTADAANRDYLLSLDTNRYAVYIGALFGLGMEALRYRDAVPDAAKLFFAGRLAGQHHGPEDIQAILRTYFGVPVHVEEFTGRWMHLPDRYRTRLGGGESADAIAAATLGGPDGAAVAGASVWNCQSTFRIILGPMRYDQFVHFVPGGRSERRLRAWVRTAFGDQFAWEAVVVLAADDVPATRLGGPPTHHASRLGWTSWTQTAPASADRADLVIRSEQGLPIS
ncbi:MAG: type VI secretion system baseplate subunit TssG [Phycisphaeraceae bacterium]|nr:type VI secretion system baseplate subunit TssG [Phycisphaeraceae bacterium]